MKDSGSKAWRGATYPVQIQPSTNDHVDERQDTIQHGKGWASTGQPAALIQPANRGSATNSTDTRRTTHIQPTANPSTLFSRKEEVASIGLGGRYEGRKVMSVFIAEEATSAPL